MQKKQKSSKPDSRRPFDGNRATNEFLREFGVVSPSPSSPKPFSEFPVRHTWPQFGRAAKVSNAALLTYCGVIRNSTDLQPINSE